MEKQSFLVVDDDAAERSILTETIMVAFPGSDVRQLGDPDRVTGVISEFDFDCVLMDYNMPQMDGLSLARELRARSPYLPLVMVTGVGDETLAADAVRSGVSDYIPKSRINPDAVRRAVSRAIHDNEQARTIAEQRDELESFAYALAHDFKQPIRQIRTFTKLIENELKPGDDQELQQHLTFLSEAARRLGNLVDVMAQYTLLSKIPQLGEVDLAKVVGEVRDAIAAFI